MTIDESFKKEGSVPFKWEIRPGTPKPHHHQQQKQQQQQQQQKLRPPPSGFYYSPPVEFVNRSTSRTRSDRRLSIHRQSSFRSSSVSLGCFPSYLNKPKVEKKKNNNSGNSESESESDLQTLPRWSNSTPKSLSSPFYGSSPSFSSVRSSPRSTADAEWAAFGLF